MKVDLNPDGTIARVYDPEPITNPQPDGSFILDDGLLPPDWDDLLRRQEEIRKRQEDRKRKE
jgi:hypothetical protein